MEVVKKILNVTVILSLILGYAYFEYTWADRVISNVGDNWIVVGKRPINVKLLKPWSWFIKNPVGSVLFVEKGGYGKLMDQYYFAHTLIVNLEEEDFSGITLIDVKSQKFTSISMGEFQKLNESDVKNLDWFPYDNGFMYDLSEFLKENVKTFFALGVLAQEVDITNFIACGQYEIKDVREDGTVSSLINHSPYNIANDDLLLVREVLDDWFEENKTFESVEDEITIGEVKYRYSTMFYEMTDIYSFDLQTIVDNKDALVNFHITFSDLYFSDNKSDNEALIVEWDMDVVAY